MIKHVKYTARGMNKDLAKVRSDRTVYHDARNIRLFSTRRQSTSVITNEQGNKYLMTIPSLRITNDFIQYHTGTSTKQLPYKSTEIKNTYGATSSGVVSGLQRVIGYTTSTEGFILFSTDNYGYDCIWLLTYLTNDLTLKYVRNMSFTTSNPIQAICNYENTKVEKIYWVDGNSQMRHMNLNHSVINEDLEDLIDVPVNNMLMSPSFKLNQPIIESVLYGGSHTAGRIQYGYMLYKVNGSQTKLSPLSKMLSLGSETRGGDLNEIVGTMPSLTITGIDSNFTNIKVFSIKYTSYGQEPTVSLIYDAELNSNGRLNILDDGTTIQTLSLSEIAFIGSDVIVPQHIVAKDNRLFIANFDEKNFRIPLDTRAYSFNQNRACAVYDSIYLSGNDVAGSIRNVSNTLFTDDSEDRHDSINIKPELFKYQANGVTRGGEGKYIKYELLNPSEHKSENKYFKDDELYRLGIRFYNNYGQSSTPYWVADFFAPEGNLRGLYNSLKVELKPAFYTWLNNVNNFEDEYQKPTGYQIVIAERTLKDRTIISNGMVSSMMVNDKKAARHSNEFSWEDSDTSVKMPIFLTRTVETGLSQAHIYPLLKSSHLRLMSTDYRSYSEVMRADAGKDRIADMWQYTAMMQMYSPEILFNGAPQTVPGLKFKMKGTLRNTYNAAWLLEKNLENGADIVDVKVIGGLSPHGANSLGIESYTGNPLNVADRGLFGHPGGSGANAGHYHLFYRKYGVLEAGRNYEPEGTAPRPLFTKGQGRLYDIYGSPQFAEKGQSFTNYNNDFKYRFANSIQSILIDGDADNWDDDGWSARRITNANVSGQRSLVFVLGNDTMTSPTRPRLESMIQWDPSLKDSVYDPVVYGEFVKSKPSIFLGGIYGGNTYEDKKRTNYYAIGPYLPISTNVVHIDSPGDTYVSNFRFIRMVRNDVAVNTQDTLEYEEIVEFLTETTIDLRNRSDVSHTDWDSNRVYLNNDYHRYNKVYSQNDNLFILRDGEYTVKEIDNYNTTIIGTSKKQPGETIDSWTNLLVNDTLLLDGAHGPINNIVAIKDEVYAFQNKAVSKISINPRVQVTGADGIEIELGTGRVLHDYQYLSTDTGTLNKWSVKQTSSGVIYFDTLNRNIMLLSDNLFNLTEAKGLRNYFDERNIDLSGNIDNHLINGGIITGYNQDKHNAFMTFNLPNYKETIVFDDQTKEFVGFSDDKAKLYLNYADYNLTLSNNLDSIYNSFEGQFNNFYGEQFRSSITFCVAPEQDIAVVLDNLHFSSEMYKNGLDLPNHTITHIRVYNEYQDSGLIPVEVGRRGNARQRYREWNLQLPRNAGGRDRIRNPWNFVELVFDNPDNKELILNDIGLTYTV